MLYNTKINVHWFYKNEFYIINDLLIGNYKTVFKYIEICTLLEITPSV